MPTENECPLLWARTDLDAFLLFEAASRGDVPIYTEEPDVAERERLTRSGQVIVWDEAAVLHLSPDSGKFVKTRWHHTVTWSASRMIRNFLTYRQMYPKKGPRHPRAKAPDVHHDEDLEYDLFCAFRDHENFPAGGLMRRTMSLKFNGHELHLINFYEPYSQINPANRLPTASSLPQFVKYMYELSPGILRHKHRRPPVINVLRYTQQDSKTGAAEFVERPVYGGEWAAHAAIREFHFNAGRKYWAEKLHIREEDLDFFAENPLAHDGRAAGPEPFCHSLIGRNGKRKPRKKGAHRSAVAAAAAAAAATLAKKKVPGKPKLNPHPPSPSPSLPNPNPPSPSLPAPMRDPSEPGHMHTETIPAHQTVVYPDGTSITPYSMAANPYTQADSSPTIQFPPSFDLPQYDLPQYHDFVGMQPPPYSAHANNLLAAVYEDLLNAVPAFCFEFHH